MKKVLSILALVVAILALPLMGKSFVSANIEEWDPTLHIKNPKLVTTAFVSGTKSKLSVELDCDEAVPDHVGYDTYIFFSVDTPDGERDYKYGSTMLENAKYSNGKLKVDFNPFEGEMIFEQRGRYTLHVSIINDYERLNEEIGTLTFTVSALTDESGSRITDSVKVIEKDFLVNKESSVTIEYTLATPDHDYYLYVLDIDGTRYSDKDYKSDSNYILNNYDWHSDAGELDVTAGKTSQKTFKYTFKEMGEYGVYLYDRNKKEVVADTIIKVKNAVNVDIDDSKVVNGKMPFYAEFKNNKTHLYLDSDEAIEVSVQFPYNYKNYKDELGKLQDSFYYNEGDEDRIDATYATYIKIKYTPAGSTSSRVIGQDMCFGFAKKHTFKYKAKDILELIKSNISSGDSAYAGTITIEFTASDDGGYYTNSYTESVSFSVSKKAGIKKAKASSKTVYLAYGESINFYVEDAIGGEVYVDIYKGSKKIKTLKQKCSLSMANDNAYCYVDWYLDNSSGKYVAAGKYKAVIYSKVKFTIINNGKEEQKSIVSKKKTINFKVVKPTGTLKLSSVSTGLNGGEYATFENPKIGIQNTVSIGSMVSVQIKNSKGTVIKNDKFTQGSGTYTMWYDLEKLDSNLKIGKYSATITAKTMDGQTAKKTISFSVEKSPKVELSGASVNVKDGIGSVSAKTSQSSKVSIVVKNSSGSVVATVVDGQYAAGTINANFTCGSYTPGNYSVVYTASNSGGTSSITRSFTVEKKVVVVEKPTVSALSVRYVQKNSEDAYKVHCSYTGKGAKLVIEIMWNDAEQVVAIEEHTTSNSSGSYDWTWDGYKSNGFRASAGSYTARVYAVNSAGKTEYLRQNFTISEG